MNLRIIAAGKPALAFARLGIEDYLKRLSRFGSHELIIVKAGAAEGVSQRLLERSDGCHRIAMDERGEHLTTRQFHHRIQSLESRGDIKTVAFLIGAADGHTQALRDACDQLLCVSAMTLQHELALLVLLEQLYRVASIKNKSPYHRD